MILRPRIPNKAVTFLHWFLDPTVLLEKLATTFTFFWTSGNKPPLPVETMTALSTLGSLKSSKKLY